MTKNHDPEQAVEAPVPAGMAHLTDAQKSLAGLYDMDGSLLQAVARAAQLMARFNGVHGVGGWPTTTPGRTVAQLHQLADIIQKETDEKPAAARVRKRNKQMAEMAKAPQPYLRKSELLVKERRERPTNRPPNSYRNCGRR